jgi:hypothetical protein
MGLSSTVTFTTNHNWIAPPGRLSTAGFLFALGGRISGDGQQPDCGHLGVRDDNAAGVLASVEFAADGEAGLVVVVEINSTMTR